MKPLSINLKDAKKISGDKDSSVFHLPSGHQIKIAHSALPAIQRKALEKMPIHLDEGTDSVNAAIDSDANNGASAPAQEPQPQSNETIADKINNNEYDPLGMMAQSQPQSDESQAPIQDQGAPVQSPGGNPQGAAPMQSVDLNKAYQQGLTGLSQQRDVEEQESAANAKIEQDDIDAKQNLMDNTQRNFINFQNEQKNFISDLQNSHIDPKHYQENMSAGQKVGTAIGLFLGGLSTPFTHQGNPALEFLNKQIDRDIEAQKANMENKKTIFGANQSLYHDSVMAENATRAQMNDIYLQKMKLAANQIDTSAAQAKYNMAASQYTMQNANLLQQNAIRGAVLHQMNTTGGQGVSAIDLGNAGFMNPEQAQKEQASLDAQKNAISRAKDLYGQLEKEQTVTNLANPQSYKRVEALKSELINTVMSASPSKHLTRESVEMQVNPLMPHTMETQKTGATQINAILNMIGQGADSTPVTAKYAPNALPKYPYQQAAQQQQYQVGQKLFVNGQPVQIINAKGDYRPVK